MNLCLHLFTFDGCEDGLPLYAPNCSVVLGTHQDAEKASCPGFLYVCVAPAVCSGLHGRQPISYLFCFPSTEENSLLLSNVGGSLENR